MLALKRVIYFTKIKFRDKVLQIILSTLKVNKLILII
jgi:hypothetical protein